MKNIPTEIKNLNKDYGLMLANIKNEYPLIQESQQCFFKSQSQFMDNMLTVSHPTPIRNLRQILAEINKSKDALNEAFYKNKKRQIKIKKKKEKKNISSCDLDIEYLDVEIEELHNQIETTENYMKGAIRKISSYIQQYKLILNEIGKEKLTEEDFEKEEIKYHIGKSFSQALTAARSRNGVIDEGNLIYFHQIGINGAMAQYEVSEYLRQEAALIKDGKAPTHKMTLMWLNNLMEKYENEPLEYAKQKGMTLLDEKSLIKSYE